MRGLSLIQPWAFLMVVYRGPHEKRIENRTWKPPKSIVGFRVAVHASKKWDEDGALYALKQLPDLAELVAERGWPELARISGILGSFRIDGYEVKGERSLLSTRVTFEQERWFFGPLGWLTSDPVALPQPIPCPGALGLWTVPEGYARIVREAESLQHVSQVQLSGDGPAARYWRHLQTSSSKSVTESNTSVPADPAPPTKHPRGK